MYGYNLSILIRSSRDWWIEKLSKSFKHFFFILNWKFSHSTFRTFHFSSVSNLIYYWIVVVGMFRFKQILDVFDQSFVVIHSLLSFGWFYLPVFFLIWSSANHIAHQVCKRKAKIMARKKKRQQEWRKSNIFDRDRWPLNVLMFHLAKLMHLKGMIFASLSSLSFSVCLRFTAKNRIQI